MLILWVSLIGFIYILFKYYWPRRHLYMAALKFDGPLSLPIIGSALPFIFCKNEDFLHEIYKIVENNNNPCRIWLGPKLIIIFKEPRHVEKILSSSKFSHKHDIYDLLKSFLGEGLITASGASFKQNKKTLAPFFDLQFSEKCISFFEKHLQACTQKLDSFVEKGYFDIGHIIHLYTTDVIGECVLGFNFDSQQGKNMEYVQAFIDIYKVAFERLCKPWLHPEIIFNASSLGRRQKEICDLSFNLMNNIIEMFTSGESQKSFSSPIVDKILQNKKSHPTYFPENELWAHLITLYMASQDTIALITSAACLCLGMYPDYQQRIVEEIKNFIGKNSKNLTCGDISKLTYLDMCVKDVFRLFPIAPYILRKTVEDQQIDKWSLPKDCGIIIPIYNLHKNSKYWENPNHFYPDHFLPEFVKKRPTFAYLPFSAGPRSCIGKVFANICVKYILINLLQRFEFQASGTLPDLQVTMDISLRSLNGYQVKIKARKK